MKQMYENQNIENTKYFAIIIIHIKSKILHITVDNN